jgi:hypothetical protein
VVATPAPVTPAPVTPAPVVATPAPVVATPAPAVLQKTAPSQAKVEVQAAAPAEPVETPTEEAPAEPAVSRPKVDIQPEAAPAKAEAEAPTTLEPEAGKRSGRAFRETKWFMDALDQEALSEAELHGIDGRDERYKDDGSEVDASFSLRTGAQKALRKSQALAVKKELAELEQASGRGGAPYLALAVVAIVTLGAAAWFLFLR